MRAEAFGFAYTNQLLYVMHVMFLFPFFKLNFAREHINTEPPCFICLSYEF